MAATLGRRLRRVWRHWRSSAAAGRRAFPPATLAAIATAIGAGERAHRGELRLIVEAALPLHAAWSGIGNRQRAVALFAEYGIWDTEDNCGVLIYVNLAERKVDIVADRAIARRIDAATWQAVCTTLTQGYTQGRYHDSTLAAIAAVNALLRAHFPFDGVRANELPDQAVIL
jgi:uncharacterized membrane protein